MAEAQTIPGSRISVEAAAIVASILLAFAIDASWEERQSNTRQQELIRGLILDFESLMARSDEALASADDLVSRNHELLELLASDGSAEIENIQQLLGTFFRGPGGLRTSLPILDTALGVDGVSSIQDPGFLRALTSFHDQRNRYERLTRLSGEVYFRDIGLYYRQRFGSTAVLTGNKSYPYPQEYEMTAEQIIATFRQPELFGSLEHRYNTNRNVRQSIANIREAADAALQALRIMQ